MESFLTLNIPETNIIGFGSDNCNVMMGSANSVDRKGVIEKRFINNLLGPD